MIKPLKKERFDLFMLGTRTIGQTAFEEKSFWTNRDETIIGFIAYDLTDDDYAYMTLMRDDIGRFRPVDFKAGIRKENLARKSLRDSIGTIEKSRDTKSSFSQGDEPDQYIDLLKVADEKSDEELHPDFKELIQNPAYIPAKEVIKELSPWLKPEDKNLEQEFQTQFAKRLWEVYLWAALKELRFDVEQLEAPDFLCKYVDRPLFTIEATTVNLSTSGSLSAVPDEPTNPESVREYNQDYMALKFGSSLYSKLNKEYWQKPRAKNLPLILAIADFHRSESGNIPSMGYTHSALAPYLYGFRALVTKDESGNKRVQSEKIEKHTYADKEIPSGFFNQPDAENISAVLFCNAGTISKFARMGVLAGFGSEDYAYLRKGAKYDVSDPFATEGIRQTIDVRDSNYNEYWSEELHLFHNPRAKYPVPEEYFESINQHFSKGDHIESKLHPTWIYSFTPIISISGSKN